MKVSFHWRRERVKPMDRVQKVRHGLAWLYVFDANRHDRHALLHRLGERQLLQSMERIVVDEDGNGPLRGQEVRGVGNRVTELLES